MFVLYIIAYVEHLLSTQEISGVVIVNVGVVRCFLAFQTALDCTIILCCLFKFMRDNANKKTSIYPFFSIVFSIVNVMLDELLYCPNPLKTFCVFSDSSI